MKFTTHQNLDSREIVKYLLNNKPVTQEKYHDTSRKLANEGKFYNSSTTDIDRKARNIIHIHYLN